MTSFKENDTYPRIARSHLGIIQFWFSERTDQMNLESELSLPSIYRDTENSV